VVDVVLGIETSCDETSAAVLVRDGRGLELASLVILSQDIHRVFGGVVPELASRAHLRAIGPVVNQALAEAGISLTAVDAVAVTAGPGLVGSLLVGLSFAKALAAAGNRALVGVHHLEGHIFAPTLEDPELEPPFVALVVSGGHTPRPMIDDGFDFSFSGLKTAVLHTVRALASPHEHRADLAASFQRALLDVLVSKTAAALEYTGYRTVVLGGGVACNGALRLQLAERVAATARVAVARPRLNLDNAAMIARAGWFHLENGRASDWYLDADPRLQWPGLEPTSEHSAFGR
jgi:N6-L-threonylcarbamoyladenine synthase